MYYNTNKESGEILERSREQTSKQEDVIMDFFKRHPGGCFSPEDIHARVLINAPLTSVRRALTNLSNEGKLVKTSTMKPGRYGKMVHTWELVQQGQTRIMFW